MDAEVRTSGVTVAPDSRARSEKEIQPLEASQPSMWTAVSRRIFSFPVMLAFALAVLALLTVRDRFNDPDLWWQLKTGQVIWHSGSVPTTDLFSFTTNNHAWTPHEWLSEVVLYAAWKYGGYTGLMVLFVWLTSALLIAAYALCAIYSGNAKVALLGALTVWFFGTVGLALRPHMIGFLLLTCELLVLHLARSRNVRWAYLLPPLFAVWINCHGSFILGLMVLGIVILCSYFEIRVGPLVGHRWESGDRTVMLFAAALSVAALFVNPIGLKQVLYPIDVLFNQPKGLNYVDEWQAPALNSARALGMLAVSGLICFLAASRRADLRLEELLLLTVGLQMCVSHSRMLFVFGILAAPVLSRVLSSFWDTYVFARDRRRPNAVMMLVSSVTLILAFPVQSELNAQVNKGNPAKAVKFIRKAGLSGGMLNEYVYGGYLIWALPEHKVFVDGRSDVYEWTGVLAEFGSWSLLQADPAALLEKYHVGFCLLAKDAPMAHVMPYMPGWKRIYSDEMSVVFGR